MKAKNKITEKNKKMQKGLKPSKELLEALKETNDIIKNPDKYKSYHNIDKMIEDILKK